LRNSYLSDRIKSLQRAVTILRSFSEAEPELRVTELSRRLGWHKSTVSRILSTLQGEGLVSQNPATGAYRLGLGLISLAGVALGRLDVRGIAQPHLPDLVALSEETVNVTVLDGQECVNIERAASPKPIHYVGWIGRRMPLHCTASGKLHLAYLSPTEQEEALPATLRGYTETTIVDRPQLLSSLPEIARQGYAEVHEEFEVGFSAIAAPIFGHRGDILATLAVSGPTFRLNVARIAELRRPLMETAGQISLEMGYHWEPDA
jgi:DNA-binding IclR family transcriptional regulator